MQTLTVEEVINAWTGQYGEITAELEEMLDLEMKLTTSFLQILSEGQPVSAAQLAQRVDLPIEQIEAVFEQFAARGGEFDADGNLVGAALTLNPTPHRFRVKGHDLYAWCSLDTIFLPGLIGETAAVESHDPVSGETIRLTITPDGVADYNPDSTVLSITIPGVSCRTEASCGPDTGPQSEACSQMHFFTSRETAATWLKDRPGIAIFSVEEAWQLAQANWLDRRPAISAAGSPPCAC
jgi:alkylmercury lyase